MGENQKATGESADVSSETIEELKDIIPAAFTEDQLDCQKLREILGQAQVPDSAEKYNLTWAGRRDAFELIREQTTKTLKPVPDEGVNPQGTENLFIEGDNLHVLKILQKPYYEKVKMIYLDPPYNTGKDFVYRNNYQESKAEYEERTGQRGEEGKLVSNPETSGRYHSNWLTMMYPRLFLAWNLLKEDGLLFISIDDNEVHNLRIILDEIFGEENFMADIVWNSTKSVTNTALISENHTHNLVYAKNRKYFKKNREEFRLPASKEGFSNPDDDPRGPWKADPFQVGGWRPNQQYEIENPNTGEVYTPNEGCSWKNDYETFKKLKEEDRIVFGKTGKGEPKRKRFWSEAKERGTVSTTLWEEIDTISNATINLTDLMGGDYFDNPKPVELIYKMIQLGTNSDSDIIMDFFAGSGTAAHATLDFNEKENTNHKFICVQLDEETPEDSKAREAGHETVSEIARDRIHKVIENLQNSEQGTLEEDDSAPGFKSLKLINSNFVEWDAPEDEEELEEQLTLHESALKQGVSDEKVIYELLLKEGFTPNPKIEEIENNGKTFYKVSEDDVHMFLSLEKEIGEDDFKDLDLTAETTLICLDVALTDTVKDNIGREYNLKTI